MRQGLIVVPWVAVVLAVAGAAPAVARDGDAIVLYRSIGAAHIGSTPAQIRATLGAPSGAADNKPGSPAMFDYAPLHLRVEFDSVTSDNRADTLSVDGGSYRTVKGIRIGLRARAARRLLRGYRHLHCEQTYCEADTKRSVTERGDGFLELDFDRDRVSAITIGQTLSTQR